MTQEVGKQACERRVNPITPNNLRDEWRQNCWSRALRDKVKRKEEIEVKGHAFTESSALLCNLFSFHIFQVRKTCAVCLYINLGVIGYLALVMSRLRLFVVFVCLFFSVCMQGKRGSPSVQYLSPCNRNDCMSLSF